VVHPDLISRNGVVINSHFVDGPGEPLTAVPSVGADLELVRWVEQQRNTRVGYRTDRGPIDLVTRTRRSDHGRDVLPNVPLEVE